MKQREIKFRAYFEDLDELVYPDGNGYFIPNDSIDTFLMDGLGKPINLNDLSEPDGIIFEQYTGLKDKNGSDVYEWDIVDFGNDNTAVVTFNKGSFNVFGEPLGWDFDSEQFPVKTNFEYCEVIGNIHEHKHLLK